MPTAVLMHGNNLLPEPGKPAPGFGFLPARSALGRARDCVLGAVFLRLLDKVLPALNDARLALGLQPLGHALEQLFVEPDHIGPGIGRALLRHAVQVASRLGFQRLTLDADPGAEPFYLAMGPAAAAWCRNSEGPVGTGSGLRWRSRGQLSWPQTRRP